MRHCHNEHRTRQLKRKMFDITSSEFNSCVQHFNKVAVDRKFGDEEVDCDYAWFLSFLAETNEQTKFSMEEVIGNEDEEEDKDDNDKDPQYSMFLKELTENGKSYKLKISRNDEAPCFLEYEEQDKSDGYDPPTYTDICIGNIGDKVNSSEGMGNMHIDQKVKRSQHGKRGTILTTKEVSRKKKFKEHKSITEPHHDIDVDSCYRLFLDGCIPSEYGAFIYEGKQVNYEEKVTSSDSDILIWDNVQGCSEVNNNQPVTAKKDPSLKEKLMRILGQPYNQEEYEELSEYVKEEKPICRLLPLRYRAISSALDGVTKSVLDDVPANFRKKLEAAQNDRPRALNLLRMFRFWLEHLPNEGVFKPWLDNDCLKVLPSTRIR